MPSLLGVTDSSSFRIHFPRPCSAHPNISSRSPTISEPNSIRCSTPGPPASSHICFSTPKPRRSAPHIPSQPAPTLVPPSSPTRARDEDWGQSIFQWGGELGPAPFVHFCGAPLISAFRPRSATRTPPLPLPTFELHNTLPFPDMPPSLTRTQTSCHSPSQPGQPAQLHSETLTFRQYDHPLSPTLRKRDSTQPAHLPIMPRRLPQHRSQPCSSPPPSAF